MPAEIVKRHARTRRGCLTCRIRKKKCDSSRPSCTKCERLHVQCLGYASDRPEWLKGDSAKGYTQAIKCFLSEYPAAKAYEDPVPYLVLKTTPEVEQTLARDPSRFNPVCFDPDTASLKKWRPSTPPSTSHGVAFPVPNGEPLASQSLQVSSSHLSSPYLPPTPSPRTPYTYPGAHYPQAYIYNAEAAPDMFSTYTPPLQDPYFQTSPFVATQSVYSQLIPPAVTAPAFYDQHDSHAAHYVAGAISLTRQNPHALSACKTGYNEAWAPMNWLLY